MMTPAQGAARQPWILTYEELHSTPSQLQDGFSYEKEESYRSATAGFIQDVGKALRFPQMSISTAVVFMHRFYCRKSFREYERFIVACTCLLLGGKVEETPKKLKEVLGEAYKVCYRKPAPAVETRQFWELKEKILVAERILLATLGFDLMLQHPYRELLAYVKSVNMARDFAQLAWNFVNDSLRSVVCLQFDTKTVAAAAVLMAAAHNGVELTNPLDRSRPWHEAIAPTASEADVFACANTITDIYEVMFRVGAGDAPGGGSEPCVRMSPQDLDKVRHATGATPRPQPPPPKPFEAKPEPRAPPATGNAPTSAKRSRSHDGEEMDKKALKVEGAIAAAPGSSEARAERHAEAHPASADAAQDVIAQSGEPAC